MLLILLACGSPDRPPQPRLVLLYATCTLDKHFLSPYGAPAPATPHLERFAGEAVVFRRHQTESGQSGTAFASIFSGTQADRHGVFRHPSVLGDEVELIGETFRRHGWDVVTWLEHGMASAELGYAQGARLALDHKLTASDPELRDVLERLRRDPGYRALLITDFTVTHGPYQAAPVEAYCRRRPEACAARADRETFARYVDFYHRAHAFLSYDFPATRERAAMDDEHVAGLAAAVELLYRANVARLDELFSAVVDEIRAAGVWRESVIAFTADHGETLFRDGTHFKWTHGHQLAPEVLEVPLVLRAPGVEPGVWEEVTRSIDVFPTLAGLAGLAATAADGVDLSPALRGVAPRPELTAWSHTSLIAEPVLEASRRWSLFHALYPRVDPELMWVERRRGDRVWQLRRTPAGDAEAAVFDRAADPWELENLYRGDDVEERRAFTELRGYRQRLIAAWHERAARRQEVDGERQEELLRSLGYVD